MLSAVVAFTVACDKDDDNDDMSTTTPATVAELSVSDQTISQNMIWVSMANVPANGFIVVHKDNGNGGPVVPDIVSMPKFIEMGDNMDVLVSLDATTAFEDGETLWVMLHEDTGAPGVYEFDGSNGIDGPFMANSSVVMSPIEIMSASITVMNQSVNNNMIVIPEVHAAADGWLVVHNDDGTGNIVLPGIIGKTMVQQGINTNVEVMLDAANTYTTGQLLFPMLHLDNGIIGQYEFDGASQFDGPEIFGNEAFPNNVIFTSFTVN